MFQDLRIGLRMLLNDIGFTVVAALTLALGIGANTAMFSVLNTYLFRALPYPNSDQLVRVFRTSIHSQSWPHSQGNFFDQREKNNVFEKTAPESLANALRGAVAELDPTLPAHRIRTARSLVEQGLGSVSLLGSLLGAFAALGLALAAIGIYGVISYSVVQRTGEIGIRMALGAQTRDVLRLVLGKGARLILMGALLGFGGAYAVARFLASATPTLPTRDPAAMGSITLALIVVALAACYLPARRATKVDPMEALRHE